MIFGDTQKSLEIPRKNTVFYNTYEDLRGSAYIFTDSYDFYNTYTIVRYFHASFYKEFLVKRGMKISYNGVSIVKIIGICKNICRSS